MIEIFKEEQIKFLMSEEVRKQVQKKIKISSHTNWWIGAELKSGTWYWAHSNKPITYVSRVGGNGWSTSSSSPYGYMPLSKTYGYWAPTSSACLYSLCQISEYL